MAYGAQILATQTPPSMSFEPTVLLGLEVVFNLLNSHHTRGNKYSQHQQTYLNNYFQAKVGKELPKQFPKPRQTEGR